MLFLSGFDTTKVLLLILGYSISHISICNGSSFGCGLRQCQNANLVCVAGEDCFVGCRDWFSCQWATVHCPEGPYDCSITCNGDVRSCEGITIHGEHTTGTVTVNGEAPHSLDNSNIYCPEHSEDGSKNCVININNNRNSNLQSRMNSMHIFTLNGFDILSLECNYQGSIIDMCYESLDIAQYPVISFSYDSDNFCAIGLDSGYTNWKQVDPNCDPDALSYELILNHKSTSNGFFNPSLYTTGLENQNDVNANTYSIIGNIDPCDYRLDINDHEKKYQFKLIYYYSDGTQTVLEWKQTSWLTASYIIGYEAISVPSQAQCPIDSGCRFNGLGGSSQITSYLDGEGVQHTYWFNAVGVTIPWVNNQIPAFNGRGAIGQSLYILN